MKLKYSFYNIDGSTSDVSLITFIDKNIYKFESLKRSVENKSKPYYRIHDLNKMQIERYYVEGDQLFSESKINLARWTDDQRKLDFSFISETNYQSYKGIKINETITGMTKMQYYVTVLHDDFITDYVDKELIDYLSISSMRKFGRQFQDHGIVAKKEVDFMGIRKTFAIDSITK